LAEIIYLGVFMKNRLVLLASLSVILGALTGCEPVEERRDVRDERREDARDREPGTGVTGVTGTVRVPVQPVPPPTGE
jgi:hypothetical protein